MKKKIFPPVLAILLLPLVFACRKGPEDFNVPINYFKLDNGLKVVLSQDATTPLVTVAVYYNIGFRIEPKDRTGFAHILEPVLWAEADRMGKPACHGFCLSNA